MSKSVFTVLALAGAGAIGLHFAVPSVAPEAKAAPAAPIASGADAAHPAVIELYQSQGCSSCPPALAVLDQIADRPDVLALNFAVTYWDRLGWKDIYAQPAYTARQWDYSHAQGRGNVQTPQLIVNGRAAVLGSYKAEVEKAIAANARAAGPQIAVEGTRITVAAAPATKAATVCSLPMTRARSASRSAQAKTAGARCPIATSCDSSLHSGAGAGQRCRTPHPPAPPD